MATRALENLKRTNCQYTKPRMYSTGTITIYSTLGKERANSINTTISRNAGPALNKTLPLLSQ